MSTLLRDVNAFLACSTPRASRLHKAQVRLIGLSVTDKPKRQTNTLRLQSCTLNILIGGALRGGRAARVQKKNLASLVFSPGTNEVLAAVVRSQKEHAALVDVLGLGWSLQPPPGPRSPFPNSCVHIFAISAASSHFSPPLLA